MKFKAKAASLAKESTGCIVVGVFQGRKLTRAASEIAAASGRALHTLLDRGDHSGELGTTLLVQQMPKIAAERVLLVGLGAESEFHEGHYRKALCSAIDALQATGAQDATVCLHDLDVNGRDAPWKIEQAVLAMMDRLYRFDALKSRPRERKRALKKILLHVRTPSETTAAQASIDQAVAIAEGISLARDLGNMPANICTPTYLAEQALELAKRHGFKTKILDEKAIAKLGMGGLLAMARGSCQPPRLIVMEYRGGARHGRPIVLVGKGITFDTGGISIKPAKDLDEMKFDMCGAASVFGALRAAALMKLPIDVVGIVPSTENMPGGNAVKPGDVVTTMSGQTVEVLDTDAEGRVVLCDALTYAQMYDPAVIVDIATLTGAVVTALGHVATGVFSKDDALAREVLDAGERAWDRAWPMPLWEEYQDALDSNFADFANVGPDAGDAIIAACFLSRFTKRFDWVHLDIAGTASRSGADKGATGRPVALLAHFLAHRAGAASVKR